MPPVETQTEIFRHSTWVILLVFIGGVVSLIIGVWLLRSKRNRRLGWGLLVLGVVAEGILGPGLINDRIVVSPASYALRVGFWFAPTERRFEHKDVEFITETYRLDRKGRRKPYWNVQLKNGEALEVPQGDLCRKYQERIIPLLKQHGVRFQ